MLFPCWTALKQSAKPDPRENYSVCAQSQRPTAESRESPKSLLQVWSKLFRREKNCYFHASISPCYMSKRWQINLHNGTTTSIMASPLLLENHPYGLCFATGWEENNRGTVGCPCHPAGLWLTRAIAEEMRGLWIKSNPASSYSRQQTILILSDGEESLQMSNSLASWENLACRSSFSHTIKLMPFLV